MAPKRQIRFELEGLAELARSLDQFSDQVARNITSKALAEAAEPMARAARAMAPKDSGELRESISASTRANIKGRLRNKNLRFAFVGPSYSKYDAHYAPHAHLVEFGTAVRHHKDGKYVGQAPAQPFMRPAFDQYKQEVVVRFRDILAVEVEQAARRAERKAKRQAIKAGKI